MNIMVFIVRSFFIIVLVFGFSFFAQWYESGIDSRNEVSIPPHPSSVETKSLISIQLGATALFVEIADSNEKRALGLSGRKTLPENHGMLFLFPQPGIYNFWMPNMRFPIDIIWIDQEKRVIGFVEGAEPITEGKETMLYAPSSPASYALEVNVGFVKQNAITIGDLLIL